MDLLKIYQSYYVLVTVLLESFTDMKIIDKKRSYIIFNNFIHINSETKRISDTIIASQKVGLEIFFYEIDNKVVEYLKIEIEKEEK